MIIINSRGPVFWATEYPLQSEAAELRKSELSDQRWVTSSWFFEDQEPWRKSIWAFRLKINRFQAIHLGLCRVAKEEERPNRLIVVDPKDIRAWGRPDSINEAGIVNDPDPDLEALAEEIARRRAEIELIQGGGDAVQEEAADG